MENLNLVEILKDCPKGTTLFSPMYGDVTLHEVNENCIYPIEVIVSAIGSISPEVRCFTYDGKYMGCYADEECILFPSKDCRDWSQFKVEQPKHEHKFKPFDRVLVRDGYNGRWRAEFYSCYKGGDYPHVCVGGNSWQYCIPYEGNEHLNGTTDEPKSGKK